MSTKDNSSANVTYEKSSFTPSKVLTVLSEGMTLTGNVASKGDMHVDGEVIGDIHSYRLTIGEKASVSGSLYGDEIIVSGHVKGEITGRVVRLTSTADVTGDINHDSLSIEAGAHLQGLCKRGSPVAFSVNGKAVVEAALTDKTSVTDE